MSRNHADNGVLEKPGGPLCHNFEQRCDQEASEHVAVIAGERAHTCRERDDRANQTERANRTRFFRSRLAPDDRVRVMVITIVRMTAWLLLLATVILSFAPPSYRAIPDIPLADIPHAVEHFAIFLAAGLAFGLSHAAPYLSQLIPLTLFTAAVEIVQLWVPGRHARFSDFVIDALGASVGLALGRAVVRFGGQRKSQAKRER